MRSRYRAKLSYPSSIEYHDEKDLARMLWTKYLRPVEKPDHEGFDATVAIAGDTGMGKSELALVCAIEVSRLAGVPFDVRRNVVYTREQLEAAIKGLPRYSPIVVDEAVNVLFSRDDQKNSKIIKVLEACRSRNLALFFCMPDFSAMDSKARKSRIRFWIDIKDVGEGYEFIRRRRVSSDPHKTDPWNNWAFDEIGSQLERHPNFVGVIRWSRLSEELRKAYNEHKHASELLSDDETKEADREPFTGKTVYGFLDFVGAERRNYRGLMAKAAEYMGVSTQTAYIHVRNWARARELRAEDGSGGDGDA